MLDSQVDEIKSRLDLAEIIRGYMKLEKSGINFRGLCPFHNEKTPSFFVSPARQLWRCFGCSIGGDMFSYIMQIEGVEFKEALKTLADKAGVQLRSYDPRIRSEKTRLYEVCEKSCQFFEKQLTSSVLGREAKEYLLDRGIDEERINIFRVGFAPFTRNALFEFLASQGYSPTEIFKAGVAIESSNSYYDRFRNRIIFPISDLSGQIIGFGGRIFSPKNQITDPKLAKYINTPQTALYDKSRVLYGLDKAKLKIREHNSCTLVEGYTDVIMSHKSGVENVVSISGTALTEYQLDIIRRYTDNLITSFDMDIAGDSATKRGIDMAQRKGFNIRVLALEKGKDPAEIIQNNEGKWKKALKAPLSIGDFYFATAFSKFDKVTADGMKNIANILLPMIKQFPTEIERAFWVQKLAAEFACDEGVIWKDLDALPIPSMSSIQKNVARTAPTDTPESALGHALREKTRQDILCEQVLLLASKDVLCMNSIRKNNMWFFRRNVPSAAIFLKLYGHWNSNNKQDPFSESILNVILTHEEKEYLDELLFREDVFSVFTSETNFPEEFNLCLAELKRINLKNKLSRLQSAMKNEPKSKKLLEEFKKTTLALAKL